MTDNKISMECLQRRIEKIVGRAMYELEYDPCESITPADLFIVLKYLEYATVKDEAFVSKGVFKMITSVEIATWDQVRLLVAGIEGVYLEGFCRD